MVFRLFGQKKDNDVVVYDATVAHAMVMLSVMLTPADGQHQHPDDRVINMFWLCCILSLLLVNPPLLPIHNTPIDLLHNIQGTTEFKQCVYIKYKKLSFSV